MFDESCVTVRGVGVRTVPLSLSLCARERSYLFKAQKRTPRDVSSVQILKKAIQPKSVLP